MSKQVKTAGVSDEKLKIIEDIENAHSAITFYWKTEKDKVPYTFEQNTSALNIVQVFITLAEYLIMSNNNNYELINGQMKAIYDYLYTNNNEKIN